MSTGDLHSAWSRLFVSSLASAGIRNFVVSPGSRSTPLALAVAAEPRLQMHVIVDERAAGFFALGQARAAAAPSALLCTSGTAGAHYLPAVIEAEQSHLPMLLITADRPWESYDAGAAQTIDQVKLFSGHVRHYAELGLPDPAPTALRAVVRIAAQAVAAARSPRPGPVHVNARFRKPLEPVAATAPPPWSALLEALIANGAPRTYPALPAADPRALAELRERCASIERGVIVCGPVWAGGNLAELRSAVLRLSSATGFPIWAEATSGVRFGGGAEVCTGFDALLRVPEFRKRHRPELLIELGAPPVSAAYASYLMENCDCTRIVLAPYGWNDPIGSAAVMIWGDPGDVAAQLAAAIERQRGHRSPPTAWQRSLAAAERSVWNAVSAEVDGAELSEGDVARAVVAALPAGATLMVGNSLPVRDLDLFCPASEKPLRVLHQRGASGIDGLIAGAAGAASASQQPLALLLGDLSALHDIGGLGTLRNAKGPLAVVIVQNQGGRIFEQLPIGQNAVARPYFEQLFLTPQKADFVHAAKLFGIPYSCVGTRDALQSALSTAMRSASPLLIEAIVPPEDGTARRARIWKRVADALRGETSVQPGCAASLPHVYLHGFLGSPELWQSVAARLGEPYAAEYLPGHGPLPWTLPGGDFDAVVDAMAAALPFERCHLTGYSMGARLALALAIRHPKRVASLFLVGIDPGIRGAAERAARQAWEDQLAAKLETLSLSSFVDEWESLPVFDSQRGLSPELLARQRAARLRHVPAALAWALRTLGTGRMPDLWPQLASLTVPTRVYTGELDNKFTALGMEMARVAPHIQHVTVPGAGHNLALEAPDAIFDALASATSNGSISHG